MGLVRTALPAAGLLAVAAWAAVGAAPAPRQGQLVTFQSGTVASAQDVNDNFAFVLGEVAAVQNALANLDLQGSLQLQPSGADADQSLFFADGGSPTANYLRWEDTSNEFCFQIGAIQSGFVLNIADNTSSAWMFRNGNDIEFVVDETGFAWLGSSLVTNGSCDLAETFVGPAGAELPPGTVVVPDHAVPEGVRPATSPRDPRVVGVVTSTPGVLLNGPTSGALPWARELAELRRRAAADPAAADPERAARLEEQLDAAPRGDVAVALVGRVLVRVDPAAGPVRAGDALTTSGTPGLAAPLDGPGPGFALALEDSAPGRDEVLALLRPSAGAPPPTEEVAAVAVVRAGATRCVVRDPRLRADSVPHVTFRADPGARHWVAAAGDGWFELALAAPAPADVPFAWRAR